MQTTDLGAGRGWLDAPAAASICRIDAQLGHPVQITEAGRTYQQQQEHYDRYLAYLAGGPWAPIALDPDTPSVHQVGYATDSDEADAPWKENGWFHTVYRDGVLVEPWHREYDASRDQHINDPAPTASHQENTDMGLRIITSPYYRAAGQQVLHNGLTARSIGAAEALDLRQAGVPWHDYDDEYKFNQEINQVYLLAGQVNEAAAQSIADEFGDRLT